MSRPYQQVKDTARDMLRTPTPSRTVVLHPQCMSVGQQLLCTVFCAGSTAGTSPRSFAPAGPMQAAPPAAPPAVATGVTGSSSAFKQSSTSQAGAGAGAGAVGGSASTLSSVTTGKGPLVLGSVEEGAQAQQVLQVLDNYDFRCVFWGRGEGVHRSSTQWLPVATIAAI